MDKITISAFQLFAMFPDQETARTYLEAHLWPNGAKCPTCASLKRITTRKGVSTNSIESVWAVMKRGLHGVYHHASEKHLARYVNEFTFRLNAGDVKRPTLDRLASLVDPTAGRRMTYKELTA